MSTALTHTGLLTARALRAVWRMPMFMVMNLVQPMFWLLLFGSLFKSVIEIPGFGTGGTYLEFITPGIVMMTAMFGAAWAGTTFVQDMERGVMDRFLTSPTSRGGLMVASMACQAIIAVAQALVVLVVAWLCGARFDGGIGGIAVLLLGVVLLTATFSALSNAFALLTGQQEALIGLSQLITLPLMFLSSAIMDPRLSPSWVETVARFNPFDWAVRVGRGALEGTASAGEVWGHVGLLAGATVVMAWVATQAFRTRQRSA
ncbi:ABC-2 type transporter [Beutenbergia cavernae DSM 12333]|uniref:Transport permease protein n=1 Tax=Beutenbergia cavernae (strain ATCC BAA-8 / DSM 12333 / CCUG 43141 / JCM 11478 / NBRC 16432 / NCIMB 13614 / HKI 0122) TaxID=471853 RepID=C5C2U5_BEUC1|nr:ABC transporter permease [Beutenbergia cavernae]ACQ81789.1 ABC-2 type transporter [Beutenbergia cavernae DSM 12333]